MLYNRQEQPSSGSLKTPTRILNQVAQTPIPESDTAYNGVCECENLLSQNLSV